MRPRGHKGSPGSKRDRCEYRETTHRALSDNIYLANDYLTYAYDSASTGKLTAINGSPFSNGAGTLSSLYISEQSISANLFGMFSSRLPQKRHPKQPDLPAASCERNERGSGAVITAITPKGSAALPFVIPSEAEGTAVQSFGCR